jgi:hypothetical protein
MNIRMTVNGLCGAAGMTRQNYYKERKKRERREVGARHAEELAKRERRLQPRLGGRKLFHMLAPELAEDGIKLGRDKFYGVLRERGLLLERRPADEPSCSALPGFFRGLARRFFLKLPSRRDVL